MTVRSAGLVLIGASVLLMALSIAQVSYAGQKAATSTAQKKLPVRVDVAREPKTFREIPWGANEVELRNIRGFDSEDCMDSFATKPPERTCSEDFMLGDAEATAYYVFWNDRFGRVELSYGPSQFEYVRDVFVAKYGRASSTTTVPVQSGRGASYDDIVLVWSFPNIRIEMHRFGVSLSRGVTYITDLRWDRERKKSVESSKKKAAESF